VSLNLRGGGGGDVGFAGGARRTNLEKKWERGEKGDRKEKGIKSKEQGWTIVKV